MLLSEEKGVLTLILRLVHSFTVHCAQDMCGWGAVRTWLVLLGWKPIMEPPFSPYSHPALLNTSLSLSLALICLLPNCKKNSNLETVLSFFSPCPLLSPLHLATPYPLSQSRTLDYFFRIETLLFLSFSGQPITIVSFFLCFSGQLMSNCARYCISLLNL